MYVNYIFVKIRYQCYFTLFFAIFDALTSSPLVSSKATSTMLPVVFSEASESSAPTIVGSSTEGIIASKCIYIYIWKSGNWKGSKPPEPISNVAVRCPGCKEVFWKRYLYEYISKPTPTSRWPLLLASISMYPHERDYVRSLFENLGKRWLPSVLTMTRARTTVIAHFNIDTQNKNQVACIHESIFTLASISIHIYICWKWENLII